LAGRGRKRGRREKIDIDDAEEEHRSQKIFRQAAEREKRVSGLAHKRPGIANGAKRGAPSNLPD
jgi:hypothetical protein